MTVPLRPGPTWHRRRVAREASRRLRAEAMQQLAGAQIELASLVEPGARAAQTTAHAGLIASLNATLLELRQVADSLWPSMLDDLGLADALRDLVAKRAGPQEVELVISSGPGLPHGQATAAELDILLFDLADWALEEWRGAARAGQVALPLGIHLQIDADGAGRMALRSGPLLPGASAQGRAHPWADVGADAVWRAELARLGARCELVLGPGGAEVVVHWPSPQAGHAGQAQPLSR